MTEWVYGILMQVDSLVKNFSGVAYDWSMKYKNENKTEVTVKFVEEHIETCLGDLKSNSSKFLLSLFNFALTMF